MPEINMIDTIKVLKKYKFSPSDFEIAKNDYYVFGNSVDNPNFSVEKAQKAFGNLSEKFCDILNIAISESGIKENAGVFLPEKIKRPIHTSIETETTEMNFTFGLFFDFYIVTSILNPQNIKFMKDEFWGLLFELSSLGKFGFKENEKPDKSMRQKHPQLFSKTGNYYKLLRNYFLFEADYGKIRDLGNIHLSWPSNTHSQELIPKVCRAFQIMYRINYLLWKHDNKNVKV